MSVSNRNIPTVQDVVKLKEVLIKRDELLEKLESNKVVQVNIKNEQANLKSEKDKIDSEMKILKERKAALEYFNTLKNPPVRTDAENAKVVKDLIANLTKSKVPLQKRQGSDDLLSKTELLKDEAELMETNPSPITSDTVAVEYLRFKVAGLAKELTVFLCPPKK